MRIITVVDCPAAEQARDVLVDPSYRNNRIPLYFPDLPGLEDDLCVVRAFFENWLMYMDGAEHRRLRAIVQSAIMAAASPEPALDFYTEPCPGIRLVTTETVDRYVQEVHANLMGLSLKQWHELRAAMAPIMELLHTADYEDLVPAAASAISALLTWLPKQEFADRSAAANMRTGGVPLSTIAGVMVDSYEPVSCAVKTMVYEWAEARSLERSSVGETLVSRCLREAPPFRFINRLLPSEDGIYSINLAKVGSSARGSMAFGLGPHGCPGASWAKRILDRVAGRLTIWEADGRLVSYEGKSDRDGGLSTVQELRVVVRECAAHLPSTDRVDTD